MKIRRFQTYDKFGMDNEEALQYWDEDAQRWVDVYFVRCTEENEEKALTTEDY